MKIVAIIFITLLLISTYALLKAASKADRHAELMRDFKEEK